MGEETPLEKVLIIEPDFKVGVFRQQLEKYWPQKLNICEDDLEAVGDVNVNLGVQEHGQGWKRDNYKGGIPKDLQKPLQGTGCYQSLTGSY